MVKIIYHFEKVKQFCPLSNLTILRPITLVQSFVKIDKSILLLSWSQTNIVCLLFLSKRTSHASLPRPKKRQQTGYVSNGRSMVSEHFSNLLLNPQVKPTFAHYYCTLYICHIDMEPKTI